MPSPYRNETGPPSAACQLVALTATSLNSPTVIMDYLYRIVCTDFSAAIKSSSHTLTNYEVVSSVGHFATRPRYRLPRPPIGRVTTGHEALDVGVVCCRVCVCREQQPNGKR